LEDNSSYSRSLVSSCPEKVVDLECSQTFLDTIGATREEEEPFPRIPFSVCYFISFLFDSGAFQDMAAVNPINEKFGLGGVSRPSSHDMEGESYPPSSRQGKEQA
jgi:hypothetical protein